MDATANNEDGKLVTTTPTEWWKAPTKKTVTPATTDKWQMPGMGLIEQPTTPQVTEAPLPAQPFPVRPVAATKTTPLEGPYAKLQYEEMGVPYYEAVPFKDEAKVFGQTLQHLPRQLGASILSATQGQGGASVVNRDWADVYIAEANEDLDKFVQDVMKLYPSSAHLHEVAQLSRNMAYSITSMGAGLVAGVPIAFLPVPGARVAAWTAGTAASGAVAYEMTTYQIMQLYLELKNAEKIGQVGREITLEEENKLKADFHDKAVKYGLWEAVPEALSNLLFGQILMGPLGKMIGGPMAAQLLQKLALIYGEELLTETITQKGQSAIEVEAGLREERIGWVEAFKEIAPQTFLLTTIMAGAGQVIISSTQGIKKITDSLKTEIGTDHILYNEIKQGIETDIESVVTTPETVTGITPAITEAPTVAMAEWETVSGKEPWQITKGEYVNERLASLREVSPAETEKQIVKLTQAGEALHSKYVTQAVREGKPVPSEVLKDYPDLVTPRVTEVTPEAVKPTAVAEEITAITPEVTKPTVTGFEGLATTTEGVAVTEVAGVPPKIPTNWDVVGGNLYDDFMRQTMPNPTPNTIPLGNRAKKAIGKIETIVTDEFARLNKLGWQTEVDVSYVRSADSRSAQLYNQTMKRVGDSLGWDSNLLTHAANYLTLRHQLEVLKATGRKYFTVKKGDKSTRFTAKQIGLIFAQMKKELGADYARVKKAAEFFPAVYNQLLRETSELTPEQIEGIIRKYPWFNPIIPVRETAPVNIGKRLSARQIRNLTHLEVDTEQVSPLLALPTTISKRIKANAINDAKKSIAHSAVELSQNLKDRVLIGGDAEIVFKKPTGAFIDFFEDGQRKYLKLGKGTEWIAKDIELFQRQPPGMLIKGVRSLQGLSKMFFTTYNPGFMVWNTLFDGYTSFVTEGIWPWVFAKNLGQNVAAIFTEIPSVNVFREAGTELFGFFGKGAEVGRGREITPFISEKGGQLTIKNPESLKRFINPFVLVRELGIAGENAARKATFEKAKAEGLSDKEAVLRGRRVTVDFSRFSRASRFINDWYIYFNPALQGFFLPGRAIRKDPRTLWRLSALIAAYVGLTLYNMSYDEYDDVRDSDKVGKLLVMLPSDEYNKYGQKVPHYLTLMPLREFALFTAPIEYFLGRVTTEYPDAYRTLAQEWDVLYPVISPLSMISETGGLVFPTQIGATIQQIVQNYDDFRDRPIVDDEMALLPPSQQYDQYTNGLAIKAGQALGMSPKKLDFFASNMFGALGNDFLREINRAIEAIDREEVDERIAGLVSDLREIPMTVPPNQIEVARETFLEGLSVEDRDIVLNMENLPDDKIPFVQTMVRRFFRDYGGQVYATAKEKALMDRTLEDYPPEALAELQRAAVENANNLLKDKITKYQYDQNRSRYRAYFSGASTAEWREGMTEGAVARSDIDKYMPELYQRSEEFQAVSAYMEIRQKYIDEAGGVLDSDVWDEIENKTLADLRKDYSRQAVEYAITHKDDWIDKLPEPARTVERQRAVALEDETWWDDYRGTETTGPTEWWEAGPSEGTTQGPTQWWLAGP